MDFKASDFRPGQRVQLHPATDLWMRGAQFGNVVRITKLGGVVVKLDKLVKPQTIHPTNVLTIEE